MNTKERLMDYSRAHLDMVNENDYIPDELFAKFNVNRGLRDVNGRGVLTGLTNISEIISFKEENGQRIPIDGQLKYRGINVNNLIKKYKKIVKLLLTMNL